MKTKLENRGFTLIELLIVVAIIGILAAIAIPNFLQAQVRAKVARAKADIRTIASAQALYQVDNHTYTPSWDLNRGTWIDTFYDRLKPLTTPVDYITAIPHEAFGGGKSQGEYFSYTPYPSDMPLVMSYSEDYYVTPAMKSSVSPADMPGAGYVSPDKVDVAYKLESIGPDQLFNWKDPEVLAAYSDWRLVEQLEYDPTNGTISKGDLHYWGGTDLGNFWK